MFDSVDNDLFEVRIRLKHLRQFERVAFKQQFCQEDRRQVHSDLLVRAPDAVVIDQPLQRIARFVLDGVARAIGRDALRKEVFHEVLLRHVDSVGKAQERIDVERIVGHGCARDVIGVDRPLRQRVLAVGLVPKQRAAAVRRRVLEVVRFVKRQEVDELAVLLVISHPLRHLFVRRQQNVKAPARPRDEVVNILALADAAVIDAEPLNLFHPVFAQHGRADDDATFG